MAISLAGYLYLLVFWASALLKAKAGKKEVKKSTCILTVTIP